MRRCFTVAALALIGLPAAAQTAFTDPQTLREPTDAQVQAAWPADAKGRGIEGEAVLGCTISVRGRLGGCSVIQETPSGQGFGQAALGLASHYQYQPARISGRAFPSRVRLSFSFRSPSSPAGPLTRPPLTITRPEWEKIPTPQDVDANFPQQAIKASQSGWGRMRCLVDRDGAMKDCMVVLVTPPGYGFEDAVLRMAPLFRMKLLAADDPAVGRAVNITVRFSGD